MVEKNQSEQESQTAEERRRHKRVPLGVPIQCRSAQMDVEGRAENISVSGLLVRLLVSAGQTFPDDQEITVSFAMPGLAHAVQARGRVAHVVPGRFMGVEFMELDPELAQRIEQYVAAQSVVEADKKK